MKRYWKLIILTAAVILILGLFYTKTGTANDNGPSFTIKKIQGNEEEISNILLDANYHQSRTAGSGHSLQISAEGTKYFNEQSIAEQLFGFGWDRQIERWQKEYRGYMRGKWPSLSSFFENGKFLAYADVNYNFTGPIGSSRDFTFDIDILHKETGGRVKRETEVPNRNQYYSMSVENVQVTDNVLKVFTSNQVEHQGNHEIEIHVYTFDIQTGELLDDKIIIEEKESLDANQWAEIMILNKHEHIGEEEYVLAKVLNVEHVQDAENSGDYVEQVQQLYFVSYNVETGEIKQFEIPEIKPFAAAGISPIPDQALISGSTVYFAIFTTDGIDVYSYSLETNSLQGSQKVPLEKSFSDSPVIKVAHERIYIVEWINKRDTDKSIIVADVESGEIVYSGRIELQEPEAHSGEYELYIHDIIFN